MREQQKTKTDYEDTTKTASRLRSRSRVLQVFYVTAHIVGFGLVHVLRVVNGVLVAVIVYSILIRIQIPCIIHSSKTGLLKCSLYTPRRLQ